MRILRASGLRGFSFGAAILFVVVAVGTTALVRASGRQIFDVELYRTYGDAMESGLVPYRDFDVEYPPGALPLFLAPSLVTSEPEHHYLTFALLMAVVGGVGLLVTAVSLLRLGRSPHTVKNVLVLLAVSPLAFGSVLLTRFDVVPATLVAGATASLLAGRSRAAAALIGVAAATKLYPLALLPLLVIWTWRRRGRREASVVSALALGIVAGAYLPFLVLSPEGVAASLWSQIGRPLHIESLGAGLLLVLHNAAGLSVDIESSYGSENVSGTTAAVVAAIQSLVQLLVLGWLWQRFARGDAGAERLVRYTAATLLALVALGKVFSPQFLIWPLFALCLVAGKRGARAGALYGLAVVTTAIWFPVFYEDLQSDLDPAISLLLVLRGFALLAAVGVLMWLGGALLSPATARAGPRSRSPSPSSGRR